MTTTTTYYSTDGGNGSQHRGLFRRVDDGADELVLERWTGTGWVDWPDLLAASGIGGNSEYVIITAAEAKRLKTTGSR